VTFGPGGPGGSDISGDPCGPTIPATTPWANTAHATRGNPVTGASIRRDKHANPTRQSLYA